ncbi:MAG: hypothetical protein R3E31_04880 [Chloroflexota bacterium]
MSDDIESLKEAEKFAGDESDYVEAEPRTHHRRGGGSWFPGVVLIAIGAIFLLHEITGFRIDNWWALFILIPAFSNFGQAFRSYQQNGRFTHSARGSLTGGLILTLIASAFLFNLNWGLIWPMFLIIGGLSALMGGWFD